MKIFFGKEVYEVKNSDEAWEKAIEIARACKGVFEGCEMQDDAFYVDTESPLWENMYPIMGLNDGIRYAETNAKDLFTRK
ncbi:MAG: hypothetical protein PHI87_06145 [Candidatus Methanomethylophilus sp.]|nr:hypothetical protein [Methanomethylophilus sp.]